ncbi:MAG TPA: superfamily I DNA and RNA helicase [Ruminococcaceae bacterium]|nr:superfamily I DNA and RNA helicase [Oscillospiraceae bacterium]
MDYNTLKRNALTSFFSRTNEMQRKAVFQVKGAVLIIAGAGSGKTTVLCNRIANMMRFGNAYLDNEVRDITPEEEQFLEAFPSMEKTPENAERLAQIVAVDPVAPWNILAITFTNKAAGELKQRLIDMIGEGAEKINASTFHSACVKILRREIENLGYQRSFTIYDEDDSKRVIKDVMKRLDMDEKVFNPKVFKNMISRCKDKMISPEEYAPMAQASGELLEKRCAEVYTQYQAALRAASAVDFDDIIYLTVKLFEDFPDVLDHYRHLYKYIMVDEYQDTNVAQYRLIALLAGDNGNLCVVGDDDQSIYRFRGATIENILNFEKQYPGSVVIRLEQNYRSTENILNAANAVIKNNTQRKDKALWSDLGEGEKIKCCNFDSEIAESRFVADTILDGVKNGKHYTDFALLYRSNSQSRSFENTLARSGIPYTIVGGLRFYDRKEIKDIMSYLAVLNNPYDTVRFRRIINEPKRGIGDATVEEIIRIADGLHMSPIEVCREASQYETLSRKSAALKAAANLFDELDELADTLRLDELIDAVAEKSGYIKAMQALGEEGAGRIENITELKSNAMTLLDENPETTLPDFLEQVALVSDLDSYDGDLDRVSLMTMHSAKGLEFDTVFMVGAEDNIFPSYRSMNDPAEMEEERRLAYVAITRAKRMLYITHTSYRMLYGQTMRNKLSTFVREIPENLIEKTGERVHKPASEWKKPVKPNYLAQEAAMAAARTAPVASGIVFAAGDRVKHNVFGEGTVADAKRMGNDTMLTINFDNGQSKKVMANFARIEKL